MNRTAQIFSYPVILGNFFERVPGLIRPAIWIVQALIFAASGVAAFLLRFDLWIPRPELIHLIYALPVWIVVKTITFRTADLDHGWWRYISVSDAGRLALGNSVASLISAAIIRFGTPAGFPRSIYVLDLILCFLGTTAIRVAVRVLCEERRPAGSSPAQPKRTLLYGAGSAGVALLKEIRMNPVLGYQVVGFVDDNPQKSNLAINGARVLGHGSKLSALIAKHRVDIILIAIPFASATEMTQILRRCQDAKVSYKTVPSLCDLIEGKGLAKQIRNVAVEDLLGRRAARLDENDIIRKLQGKVVAVTGAGGTIGSELCRQIARFDPRAIVAYEISENSLFELDLEMRSQFPDLDFRPEIGSVQNAQRVSEVLQRHRPSVLYHAAAYKHVPIMESHIFEAFENNLFGTYATALASAEQCLEDFVMISTDKAVRPTSVMGVTKRLAELAVNSLQDGRTRFVSVRFGNVLGSNGSVIPLFKKQIKAGGPVTVTHPDMQRYFMTIPEASQLVLQASTMGRGGEVFVLDMGDPVKIIDLARNLILLSGLRPDEDVQIEFTGMRPGEKLYEELRTFQESTAPTQHEKINVFKGPHVHCREMAAHIECLRQICAKRDLPQLVLRLKEIVPDYNPSSHVLRRAMAAKPAHRATTTVSVRLAAGL